MKVYLFGKMTGEAFNNREAFRLGATALRGMGIEVVSPLELDVAEGISPDREGKKQSNYTDVLLRDLHAIAQPDVDGLVGIAGWEPSPGACAEVAFAKAIGKPIFRPSDLCKHQQIAPTVPVNELWDAGTGGRHPSSQRVHAILKELGTLHDRKQRDYGREGDPFANVRASEEWGIKPWVGALIRATDKLRRLQTYAKTGTLANEGVVDAFDDLAVYAIIGRVLFEEGPDGHE